MRWGGEGLLILQKTKWLAAVYPVQIWGRQSRWQWHSHVIVRQTTDVRAHSNSFPSIHRTVTSHLRRCNFRHWRRCEYPLGPLVDHKRLNHVVSLWAHANGWSNLCQKRYRLVTRPHIDFVMQVPHFTYAREKLSEVSQDVKKSIQQSQSVILLKSDPQHRKLKNFLLLFQLSCWLLFLATKKSSKETFILVCFCLLVLDTIWRSLCSFCSAQRSFLRQLLLTRNGHSSSINTVSKHLVFFVCTPCVFFFFFFLCFCFWW